MAEVIEKEVFAVYTEIRDSLGDPVGYKYNGLIKFLDYRKNSSYVPLKAGILFSR